MKSFLAYIFIIAGAIITIMAKTTNLESPYVFILGIVLLMYGLYSVSKGLSSKKEKNTFIEEEKDNNEV